MGEMSNPEGEDVYPQISHLNGPESPYPLQFSCRHRAGITLEPILLEDLHPLLHSQDTHNALLEPDVVICLHLVSLSSGLFYFYSFVLCFPSNSFLVGVRESMEDDIEHFFDCVGLRYVS